MLIKLIYEAFCRSLIRFFDNRFVKNDEVSYYRMELEKLRQENFKLTKHIIDNQIVSREVINPPEEEETEWKPANNGYTSWEKKRRELETASLQKALTLKREAEAELNRAKSTEELEAELLHVED